MSAVASSSAEPLKVLSSGRKRRGLFEGIIREPSVTNKGGSFCLKRALWGPFLAQYAVCLGEGGGIFQRSSLPPKRTRNRPFLDLWRLSNG